MDIYLNVTYITVDGYVELHKYRFLYFVIMFTAFILAICSNFTIIIIIFVHKNLHEPMYIFIAALLWNSVVFSAVVYPKLLLDLLSDEQLISYPACLFQWFAYYTLGSSEFILLSVMAYDRYVSICKPLQYPLIMSKTKVTLFIALAWLVPASEIIVITAINANRKLCHFVFNGIICNSLVYRLHCVTSRALNIYGLFVFVNLDILPVLFILFSYTNIFIVSHRSGREVRKKAVQTCLPHLLVLINFSCFSAYDVLLLRMETEFSKTVRFIMTIQLILYHPLFNPVMYGLKMTEISKHLKRLFCLTRMI
ncbi:olfactory receptor 6N2-like [Sphaeramia orbicularis]|uniref:olfactory receptor 6N2-like n=1 Tax=Sphaeramia orbicularis TaxID=375764 RepID=UPI001181179E|nr:olfactory receptor 6N2-like [Sphaeramia orbicularis]